MKDRPLHVAPVDRKAAEFAVLRWHYSEAMPAGRLMCYGVWEFGEYVGAIIYGRGANNRIASEFGLSQPEVCELVRVALRSHAAPVSQAVGQTLRQMRRDAPGVRAVVSYADPAQGHHGGIYQAGNWTYTGHSHAQRELLINGREMHKRSAHSKYGTASVPALRARGVDADYAPKVFKLKYVYPLDRAMRRQITPLALPYPKRDTHAQEASRDAPGNQPGEGGSIPTPALKEPTADVAGGDVTGDPGASPHGSPRGADVALAQEATAGGPDE